MGAFKKRVAMLGSGFPTQITIPALRAENWDVRALFSRNPDRAKQIAGELEIPHHSADATAIIKREDIDVVVVSTPTSTHHGFVLSALAAGKHVLCEKPLAFSLEQGREMLDAAQASGLTAMCNFEFRFTEPRLHITRLVQEGRIGTPQSAIATLVVTSPLSRSPLDWRSRRDMGGGALNEHGSHYFDALRSWMGEVTSVSCHLAGHETHRTDPETGERLESDVDDFFSATLTFESGASALVGIVWSERVPASGALHLIGPGGTISHTGPRSLFESGPVTYTPPLAPGSNEAPPLALPDGIIRRSEPQIIDASRSLLREFERGVAEGYSPAPNFEDGFRTQAILDAARESALTGRVIPL